MDKPIYIVGGFSRSGTTMMMDCLRNGGIPLDDNLEDNLEFRWMRCRRMSDQLWDMEKLEALRGKACKAPWHDVLDLPPLSYRTIIMVRDHMAIRQSTQKLDPEELDPRHRVPANYYGWIHELVEHLQNRCDTEVVSVQYEDVLADPGKEMKRLVERGWEINPWRAASVVDATQCHYESKVVCNG